MSHYTFPNGAVQGGALCHPGELEAALTPAPPKSHDERMADLCAAFGLDPDNLPRSMTG